MPYLPMTAFQKIMGDYMKNEKAKQFLRFLSVAGNFKLKTNAFLLSCFIVPALMLFSNIVMAQALPLTIGQSSTIKTAMSYGRQDTTAWVMAMTMPLVSYLIVA